MRILVAGATGAVGLQLVPQLIAAGHSVVGTTRTPAKAEIIKRMGAEPAIADGLDAPAIRAAVIAAKPDVVIDQMTDLGGGHRSPAFRPRLRHHQPVAHGRHRFPAGGRTRGRRETFHRPELLRLDLRPRRRSDQDGGRCAGSRSAGGTAPHAAGDPASGGRRHRLGEPEGIVLRYGSFYGPDTGMLSRAMIDQLRRRRVPLIGGGGGRWSFIHVDDAAVRDRCRHRARQARRDLQHRRR